LAFFVAYRNIYLDSTGQKHRRNRLLGAKRHTRLGRFSKQQLIDIDADRAAGRRTTVVTIGAVSGKFLLSGLLAAEIFIVWPLDPIVAGFLAVSMTVFLLDALVGFGDKPYPQWVVVCFFMGWNIVAMGSMYWLWQRGTLVQ
jgi:hypothetical protein